MCGIVGVIGWPITKDALEAFHTLFYLNELRGGDGVGFVSAKNTSMPGVNGISYQTIRDHQYTAEQLQLYSEDYEKLTTFHNDNRLLMAHCRAATVGGVTKENTHPIILPSLIGVHNGTLKLVKYNAEGKTDSQVLYETIEAVGWPTVYEEIKDQPYALAWVDTRTHVFSLTRSKDRPMSCLKLNTDTLFFASDWKMLDFVRRFHNLSIPKGGLFEVMPGELIEFNLKKHTVTEPIYVGPSIKEKKVG